MTINIKNLTVLPNLRFVSSNNKGQGFGVFMVKGAFDIDTGNIGVLSEEQEPFCFTDTYYGKVNTSSLKMPSDLIGYKPRTDIIFSGTAHAPNGQAEKSWLVGIQIGDENGVKLEKKLRIYGPRYWVPKWKRELSEQEKENWKDHRDQFDCWELSEAQPITSLPICYEYAYGGSLHKGKNEQGAPVIEAYEYNPIGCGLIDPEWTDHTKPQRAPQIEDPDDPVIEPYKRYSPAGYGGIPPAWLPRRPLGGTYDQNWIDNIWPKWPPDYDFSYNNSAADGLKGDLFLSEDIEIILVNLQPDQRVRKIKLTNPVPTMSLGIRYDWDTVMLNLDTLYIDGEQNQILCTWRSVFEQYKYEALILRLARPHYHDRYSLFRNAFITGIKPEDVALEESL